MIEVYGDPNSGAALEYTLEFMGRRYPCALGPAGIKSYKIEGDGVTPAGILPLRRVFYRPDRLIEPETGLTTRGLTPTDIWCDDPTHKNYNTLESLPFSASHEEMWRTDNVYDIIVELGYNDDPPVPGNGSAIFMHIARPDCSPTQGCVALTQEDLYAVLKNCQLDTRIRINL